MQDFNKLISLFIGLFVVIFVIAFAFGRIKIGSKKATPKVGGALGTIFNIPQPTLTPMPTPQKISIRKVVTTSKNIPSKQSKTQITTYRPGSVIVNQPPTAIPKTGPEMLIPEIGGLFLAGAYLLAKSRNS